MDIVIPAELTGATQRQAGLQMSQAIQSFADVSRQTTEQVNNTNAYIEALDHENKMTQIYDGAAEELRGLDYEELLKRKREGVDPYSLANNQAADYLNGISNIKVKQYAAQKMSYIQYKMDQKANAIEEHKRVSAGQAALDANMKDVAERASSYMYDPNIRPDDQQLKNAEKLKAEGKDPFWINDPAMLNEFEESRHWDRSVLEMQGKITGAVTAGIITHQQAQVMDQQMRINIALAIARNNPTKANEFFNQQEADMEPMDFERGKQALHAFVKEKSTTDAVQSLQDEFRLNDPDGDWAGAVKKIFDHKNWADYGISSAEDAIRVMGLLTHSVSSMVQTVKLQEQHQIDSIWETQVAPLLKKGNLSQVNKVIDNSSISDSAKNAAKLDAKRFLDAMKRGSGSGGDGGAGSVYFNPADVPDQIYNNKKIAKHTAQMFYSLASRVNPKEYGAAWDTAMSELQGLAAKKDKAGEKITISDIDYLFGTITTNPKFLKNAKRNLGDALGGKNVPTVIPTTPDGKPNRNPVRIQGESVDAFNRRVGAKRAFGVDVTGNPNPFGDRD